VAPLAPESSFEASKIRSLEAEGGDELVSVIVKLEDASLAAYTGDVPGLAATSPSVTGADKLDVNSAESRAYLDYLEVQQESFVSVAKSSLNARVTHRYDVVFGGISMLVPESQVDLVAKLPGVEAVYPDELLQLHTDRSPSFIGATRLWNQLGGKKKAGEGVVVGVLDTGIWPEHPSFSDPDPFGKAYDPPPGGPYECDFGNTAWNPNDVPFTCNNKLIGAHTFLDTYKAAVGLLPYDPATDMGEFDSARDSDGHGSHTASTAAGNGGVEASIFGIPRGIVSGIAPRSHVVMYRVCAGDPGGCYTSDSAAAVQQAILDGVDALNFSIGGGGSPYSDPVSLAFLDAYASGVFVACSSGNSGPGADTTGHREPWTTTVGASTTDRHFLSTVTLQADGGDTLTLIGASVTEGIDTPTPVVFPPSGEELCLDPFAAGTFSGEIVICERGVIARVAKSYNVAVGGAGGLLLYNPVLQGLNTDNHFIPSVHLENDAGATLLDFMATHSGVTATFTQGEASRVQGDVMAAFSSRGGPGQTLGVSKPDVTAPGVQILAGNSPLPAYVGGGSPGELFQSLQGTSMSSPHVAGAAALLKDLHPDWTPGQIKSALMTTARAWRVFKEDGVTPADPFDYGSGRIQLNKAGDPGLTFDASAQDYVDHENDLWNANYPSLYIPVMPGKVTVQRTVHSELSWKSWWRLWVPGQRGQDFRVTVPRILVVPAGGDATFDITIDARDVPLGEVRHATLHMKSGRRRLQMPITIVRNEPVVTLAKSCDPVTFPKGDTTDCTITIENTSFDDATVNLVDQLPKKLKLVSGSVVGAVEADNGVTFDGTLAGAAPPEVTVGVGASPFGYVPLSDYFTPIGGVDDETIVNFPTDPFVYAGETYDMIGMVSNGYAVVGGGDSADIDYINQVLPDPARPNNVLAPFWTDLNPSVGGALYAGYLSADGVNWWLALEWDAVPNYGDGEPNTFQIWVGVNGVEDITFTYGEALSDGDGGLLTVGAENAFGNSGQNYYANGVGTLPVYGIDVGVTSVPGAPGDTHIITFTAEGKKRGHWKNCAEMTGDIFYGTNIACFSGEVTQ
jgi:uncharacterized repeat protein (TIGR01451 family)